MANIYRIACYLIRELSQIVFEMFLVSDKKIKLTNLIYKTVAIYK